MGKLRIKWPDGTKEDINTDHTPEGLANERFGDGYDEFVAKGGAIIEPAEDGEFAPDDVEQTGTTKCGPPDDVVDPETGLPYTKEEQKVIAEEAAAETAYQKSEGDGPSYENTDNNPEN